MLSGYLIRLLNETLNKKEIIISRELIYNEFKDLHLDELNVILYGRPNNVSM